MKTTKVKNTEQYTDSQGTHTVCRGRLIIRYEEYSNEEKAKGAETWKNARGLASLLPYKQKFIPIIISETELLPAKTNCKVYNSLTKNVEDYYSTEELKIKGFSLVLALPEHFSPKQLEAIIDGKIKDEVYVEVEKDHEFIENTRQPYTKEFDIIKLTNNKIKLFSVKPKNWAEVLERFDKEERKKPQYFLNQYLDKFYPLNKFKP